jgi:hypothetical protein
MPRRNFLASPSNGSLSGEASRRESCSGGAQADRPRRASDYRGRDSQGAAGSRRRGHPDHPRGQVHGHLRHYDARHDDPATRRHTLPNRLEYQNDDGRGDRTTGPGRSSRSQRSGLEIRFGRARRRPDHHRRLAEDAQRPLQLHRCPGDLGKPRRRPDQGLDPGRSANHRVQAPGVLATRYGLSLLQHQLRAARPRRRGARTRKAAGQDPSKTACSGHWA